MSEVTKYDVLDAADALLHRLDLIDRLDDVLPRAKAGDVEAMREAAILYAKTGRPQLATHWRKKCDGLRAAKAPTARTAASTS